MLSRFHPSFFDQMTHHSHHLARSGQVIRSLVPRQNVPRRWELITDWWDEWHLSDGRWGDKSPFLAFFLVVVGEQKGLYIYYHLSLCRIRGGGNKRNRCAQRVYAIQTQNKGSQPKYNGFVCRIVLLVSCCSVDIIPRRCIRGKTWHARSVIRCGISLCTAQTGVSFSAEWI